MAALINRLALVLIFTASAAASSLAQPSSGKLAQELTAALTTRHLDAYAAHDPAAPDRFVAALLFPGVQLLVVGGSYPVPAAIEAQLAAAQYRDAYLALQGNAIPESKLFVQDMGADGLREKEAQAGDVVYQKVVTQTVLSGDIDGAYKKKLDAIDVEYSKLLQVLIDALKVPAAAG
jgi:hypothetical protein